MLELMRESEIICVCPELLAGQPVPRCACNIHGGDGECVINGMAKVIGTDGQDYTQSYLDGAQKALKIALENNVTCAYLKSKSPTCGCGKIYDETGQNLKIGNGIFAALLLDHAIEVISLD